MGTLIRFAGEMWQPDDTYGYVWSWGRNGFSEQFLAEAPNRGVKIDANPVQAVVELLT